MIASEKNQIKIYQTTTCFYSKKDLKLIKNSFFLVKKWEILVIICMIMFTRSSDRIFNPMHYTIMVSRLAGSFKSMNRPDRDVLWRPISGKLLKIRTYNFDTILIQVSNLFYQSLTSIYLMVWKLRAFRYRRIIGYFPEVFVIITFDWKGNLNTDGFIGKI